VKKGAMAPLALYIPTPLAERRIDCSQIFKHWAICHQNLVEQPEFVSKVLKTHKTALDKQIHEAAKIFDVRFLNARCEL